jgi:hypothetical protein
MGEIEYYKMKLRKIQTNNKIPLTLLNKAYKI